MYVMIVCAPLSIWSTRRLSKAVARLKRTVTWPPRETAERLSMRGSATTDVASNRVRMENARERTVWLFYHSLRLRVPQHPARGQLFILLGRGVEHLLDEARVQCVTGFRGADLADDRPADECEVAEQIEDLVADELVPEAKLAAHDALVVEHDAVIDRAAARETGSAELLDVAHEAERAGGGDLLEEAVVIEVELQRLPADDRVLEIDLVLENQAICGGDADALVALDDLDRLTDLEDRDLRAEGADAGGVDEMHERK